MVDETGDGTNDGTKDPYLELEYQECLATTRYVSDIRFNYFASFVASFGILVGAYYFVLTSEAKVVDLLKPYIMLGISAFGAFMGFIALMVETRNRAILRTCANHATDLEDEMPPVLHNQLRRLRLHKRLQSSETLETVFGITATHGRAIMMTYWVIFILWLELITFSAYQFSVYTIAAG